jgi:hypothetical protein
VMCGSVWCGVVCVCMWCGVCVAVCGVVCVCDVCGVVCVYGTKFDNTHGNECVQ